MKNGGGRRVLRLVIGVHFLPLVTITCGDGDSKLPSATPAASVADLLANTDVHRFRTLGAEYLEGDAVLARIVGARLAHDGSRVFVLDEIPPFIKVFDEDGGFDTAFVTRGPGPGEARLPFGIGSGADGRILLIHGGRVTILESDGRFVRSVTSEELGFRPLAATGACDGRWVLYGPGSLRSEGGRNGWLYVGPGSEPWVTPASAVYSDSVFPSSIGLGAVESLAASESRIVFGHKYSRPVRILEKRCGSSEVREVRGMAPLRTGDPGSRTRRDDRMALSITYGSRSLRGLALLEAGILIAHRVHAAPDDRSAVETELTVVTRDSMFRAGSRSRLTVRDGRPGVGVLFSISDLVPRVFLIPEDEIMKAFRAVPPSNRGPVPE